SNVAQRFIFPLIPGMAVLGGAFCGKYLNKDTKVTKLLKIPLLALVIIYSFIYSFSVDLILLNDSRIMASKWIEKNIPKNSPIIAFSYSQYLPIFEKNRKAYRINAIHNKKVNFDRFLTQFKQRNFGYIVLSDRFYSQYINSKQYPKRSAFYNNLLEGKLGYNIVAEFKYKPPLHPKVDFANPKIVILKQASLSQGSKIWDDLFTKNYKKPSYQ
ncbi:MAG: hypothetical protein WBB66_02890, partial [Candidatus Omnitrophota bacterium]